MRKLRKPVLRYCNWQLTASPAGAARREMRGGASRFDASREQTASRPVLKAEQALTGANSCRGDTIWHWTPPVDLVVSKGWLLGTAPASPRW